MLTSGAKVEARAGYSSGSLTTAGPSSRSSAANCIIFAMVAPNDFSPSHRGWQRTREARTPAPDWIVGQRSR
jgi:hypothetical protein